MGESTDFYLCRYILRGRGVARSKKVGWTVDTHGECREREPITGVWGPQRGPGAEPLVRESGGEAPAEAENLFSFWSPTEAANLFHSLYFVNALNPRQL